MREVLWLTPVSMATPFQWALPVSGFQVVWGSMFGGLVVEFLPHHALKALKTLKTLMALMVGKKQLG